MDANSQVYLIKCIPCKNQSGGDQTKAINVMFPGNNYPKKSAPARIQVKGRLTQRLGYLNISSRDELQHNNKFILDNLVGYRTAIRSNQEYNTLNPKFKKRVVVSQKTPFSVSARLQDFKNLVDFMMRKILRSNS